MTQELKQSEDLDYESWANRLADVAAELMKKKSLSDLLSTILRELRRLTNSDAGSIYRIIEDENGEVRLQFEQSQNDSVDIPEQRFSLSIDRSSIAGYVACEGEFLKIDDVYDLDRNSPFSFNKDFDQRFNYRTKSMLVVPMKNRNGQVRGVLQLMNRKTDYKLSVNNTEILPYPQELTEMVTAFSSQAAVAMERAQLDESIQGMIESMIHTLVNALDQRDEITTGHSRRLADYALHLAKEIDDSEEEPWQSADISESEQEMLYFSGLLHDIGKIAVPESILGKENRLSSNRIKAIQYRLAYLESKDLIENSQMIFQRIQKINRTGYLEEEERNWLKTLKNQSLEDEDRGMIPLLEDEEYNHLSIKKGNLTMQEIEQIRYHAKASKEILEQVQWTDDLERVPEVASQHHEKLDGSGYPQGLEGDEISLLSRILAVVDIYEALTARDRPYKSAIPPEEAEEILRSEVDEGHLDPNIVQTFFEKNIHKLKVDNQEIPKNSSN